MSSHDTIDRPGRFHHRPALDGIRAVAVLAVMGFHGGVDEARAGFIGVDMFLVLSGFLITTLLVGELTATSRIAVRDFWLRRFRRLLPALVVVLVAVALYAHFWGSASEQAGLRGDLLGSLFYVQNWRVVIADQSYFDQFLGPSLLRHMWSLAIEEQWYLVWPALLMTLARVTGRRPRALASVILVAAAASVVLMWWFGVHQDDPTRAYYGTDTRAQALLMGAALAVVLGGAAPRVGRVGAVAVNAAGVAGLAFLAWVTMTRTDTWSLLYRGGFLLVAVATTAVIAAAMTPGPVRVVLGCPPLPAIGLISYGLYLWHWPVDVVMSPDRVGLSGGALFVARTAVAFLIATGSYLLVERPIRIQRWAWTRGRVAWIPVTAAAAVAVILLTTTAAPAPAGTPRASDIERFSELMTRPPAPGVTKVLIEGDSVAASLAYPEFESDWGDTIWLRGSPRIGCGLFGGTPLSEDRPGDSQDRCADWTALFRSDVENYGPDLAVLLLGGWEVFDRQLDGRTLRVGTPEMEAEIRNALDRAARTLTRNGAHLVVLTTPCFSPRRAELGQWGEAERSDPSRVDWLNEVWRGWVADHPETTVLDLGAEVCPGGQYVATLDGVDMRTDGTHFTEAGGRRVWRWLAPSLRLIAQAVPDRARPTTGSG